MSKIDHTDLLPSTDLPDDEPGFGRGRAGSYEYEATGHRAVDISAYPGRLICVEGTDGAGRSTQIALLREELENRGHGVVHTGLTRGGLAGSGLRQAKEGHTLGRLTTDLFYATDFADRLQTSVLPALRAGFVVFTDRYVYSTIARSVVRGTDRAWIESVYRFAPKPHETFYLDVSVEQLVRRVLSRGGFDYWESGMDCQPEGDIYGSFMAYQGRLLKVYREMAEQSGMTIVDANGETSDTYEALRAGVLRVVEG
ncbi:MAG: thymidylate kinase [Planctomycetota bacterium]